MSAMKHWPECNMCDLTFRTQRDCTIHMDDFDHWEPLFDCKTCDRTFRSQDAVNQHMTAKNHWKPTIPCERCSLKFHTKEGAELHMQEKLHFRHYCSSCRNHFPSENVLQAHHRIAHEEPVQKKREEEERKKDQEARRKEREEREKEREVEKEERRKLQEEIQRLRLKGQEQQHLQQREKELKAEREEWRKLREELIRLRQNEQVQQHQQQHEQTELISKLLAKLDDLGKKHEDLKEERKARSDSNSVINSSIDLSLQKSVICQSNDHESIGSKDPVSGYHPSDPNREHIGASNTNSVKDHLLDQQTGNRRTEEREMAHSTHSVSNLHLSSQKKSNFWSGGHNAGSDKSSVKTRPSTQKKAKRTKTGNASFPCPFCHISFPAAALLSHHLQIDPCPQSPNYSVDSTHRPNLQIKSRNVIADTKTKSIATDDVGDHSVKPPHHSAIFSNPKDVDQHLRSPGRKQMLLSLVDCEDDIVWDDE